MTYLAFTILIFLLSAPLAMAKKDDDPVQSYRNRIYWGECKFNFDPEIDDSANLMWPAVCIQPKISSSLLVKESEDQKYLLQYGEVYAGVHLNRYFSYHGEWQKFRLTDYQDSMSQNPKETFQDFNITKKSFFQWGNSAFSNIRLAAGRMPVPFGINRVVLQEVYGEVIKNQKYWRSADWVAKLTVDNQVSSQYDVAFATDEFPLGSKKIDDKEKGEEERKVLNAVSARMMFDIGALAGFRLVFSGYGENEGQRRFGFGFFTVSENGDSTAFEWIRLITSPDGKQDPFEQLFRLNFLSEYQKNTRWSVEYEDDRFGYRIFTFGPDFRFYRYGSFRAGLAYMDTINVNEKNYILFSFGLGAHF